MAETLTIDTNAPTETVTDDSGAVENLTPEEQDSLQVGSELQEQQEQLYAGKYKTAEDLEKPMENFKRNLETKVLKIAEQLGTPKILQKWSPKKTAKKRKKLHHLLQRLS